MRVCWPCLLLLPSLAGCSGFLGATNTLDVAGPHSLAGQHAQPPSPSDAATPGVVADFELSFALADADQRLISAGLPAPAQASTHARQMAVDGIKLADVYCQEFFASSGANQKWLGVGKDLITATGAAAGSLLALSSPANAAAAGAIGLFTATATNGVDLYTRNFLFGADNIDTVRSLVIAALAAHAAAVLPTPDGSAWDFHAATQVVRDHQYLCSPAKIRSLVLAAIKDATPAGGALQAEVVPK
jgi:hypothetical protein